MKRTGASFFFYLDITHLRSADATAGTTKVLDLRMVSFGNHHTREGVWGVWIIQKREQGLGLSVNIIRIFTIF
jgi:hypothetical protein